MHIETDATKHLSHAAEAARAASRVLARAPAARRDAALRAMAASVRREAAAILDANASDLAESNANAAFRDRLMLDPARVEAMAVGLENIAALPDPLDRTLAEWTRPNGLRIQRIATPIGVIGMIYESRPNVGADAAGLCLKSGNAVILRGGSESLRSARAINAALVGGLREAGLPEAAVQIAPGADRAYVAAMLARGRADRPDHPARRALAGGAGAARGTRAGARARRGALPHLCPCRRRPGDGAAHRRQREDATDRGLRGDRDAADRCRRRAGAAARYRGGPARARL